MTGKEVVKLLEKNGFRLVRIRGSHHRLSDGVRHVTVAVHAGQEIPAGTLSKILKEAGLK